MVAIILMAVGNWGNGYYPYYGGYYPYGGYPYWGGWGYPYAAYPYYGYTVAQPVAPATTTTTSK